MKNLIIVLLICTMACGSFTSCVGNERKSTERKQDDTVEIDMLIKSHPSYPYREDWWIWEAIEQETNVKLNITAVPNINYIERVDIIVSSSNIPDIVILYDNQANRFGLDDVLLDINKYSDRMPNFKKWTQRYPDIVKRNIAADGGLYLLPTEGMEETERKCWLYREDIFEKNNLQVPKSTDELYETLKILKQRYPYSYPLALRLGLENFNYIAPQWNASHDYYYDEVKGEWQYGPIEDEYKNMVIFFKQLYMEKLMPPDFMTVNTKQWQDMIADDKVFVTVDFINRIDFFNVALKNDKPDFKLNFTIPPTGGENGINQFGYSSRLTQSFGISKQTENLDEVLKVIDFLYSEEGRDLVSWGVEGETYRIENGKRYFLDVNDMADIRKKYGISTVGTYLWYDYSSHMSTFSGELQDAIVKSRKYDGEPNFIPAFTKKEYNEVIDNYEKGIAEHKEQEIAKFILGARDIKEWDMFVDEIKALGLEKMLESYNNAHKRALNNQ